MFVVFSQSERQICCSLYVQEEKICVFAKASCLPQGTVSMPWLYKDKVAVKSLSLGRCSFLCSRLRALCVSPLQRCRLDMTPQPRGQAVAYSSARGCFQWLRRCRLPLLPQGTDQRITTGALPHQPHKYISGDAIYKASRCGVRRVEPSALRL